MATITQLPGVLDIEVGLGDDLSLLLDWDINLTGYTFEGKISKAGTGTITDITIINTDLAAGKITLILTDTQILALGAEVHGWYLRWTVSDNSRRVLTGAFTIKST